MLEVSRCVETLIVTRLPMFSIRIRPASSAPEGAWDRALGQKC